MEGASEISAMTSPIIEELTQQYSCSGWSHRMGAEEVMTCHMGTVTSGSEKAKQSIQCELDISYGLSDRQKIDIFAAQTLPGDAPIYVFIHGGYWQEMERERSCFMAPPLCKAGAVVMVIGYDLAPAASIDEIVDEVKKAVTFVLNMAKRRGSSGVYLCGHSAGGQLAAMMLGVDWLQEQMISGNLIKGAVLVSGVYDLRPLVNTSINNPLKMTDSDAWRNSPMRLVPDISTYSSSRHIIIAVGEHDPPEIRRQSQELEQALKSGGVITSFFDVPNTDHFNVIENLAEEDYILSKETIKLMGLNIEDIVCGMADSNLSGHV